MQKPNKKKEFENGKNIPLLLGFPLGEAKFTLGEFGPQKTAIFFRSIIFFLQQDRLTNFRFCVKPAKSFAEREYEGAGMITFAVLEKSSFSGFRDPRKRPKSPKPPARGSKIQEGPKFSDLARASARRATSICLVSQRRCNKRRV